MNIANDTLLYAINSDIKILKLIVDHTEEVKAFGRVIYYNVYFHFLNDSNLNYFKIDVRHNDMKDVELCKVFTDKRNILNNEMPYYLIGDNVNALIEHYINKLEESIAYQQKVIDDGIAKISNLQYRIVAFKDLMI